jgi:predicted nucleic acid-binding protein
MRHILLDRAPWVNEARVIWQAVDDGQLVGYLAATSLTNIFYIARRLAGLASAHTGVRICLEAFEVCTINRQLLEHASLQAGGDFEDNLQIACAEAYGLEAIVTRDPAGFQAASIPVLSPVEIVAKI